MSVKKKSQKLYKTKAVVFTTLGLTILMGLIKFWLILWDYSYNVFNTTGNMIYCFILILSLFPTVMKGVNIFLDDGAKAFKKVKKW